MGTRILTAAVVFALFVGCARRAPLPPSHAEPAPAPGQESHDPLAAAPEREEVRRLHTECDATVIALEEGVEDADRRENILTGVAAVAYVVGTLADGDARPGGMYGPGSSQAYRCTPGTNEGPGCTFQPLPSRAAGEGGPIDQETDQVHLEASDQIREINRGLDALDDFLFSNPDPDEWTPEERQHFEALTHALGSACAG
jgi:hypothetical protein